MHFTLCLFFYFGPVSPHCFAKLSPFATALLYIFLLKSDGQDNLISVKSCRSQHLKIFFLPLTFHAIIARLMPDLSRDFTIQLSDRTTSAVDAFHYSPEDFYSSGNSVYFYEYTSLC